MISNEQITSYIFEMLTSIHPGAIEGRVMSEGPPPYRRIDLAGHPLAYVRRRAAHGYVRIDIPERWGIKSPIKISDVSEIAWVMQTLRGAALKAERRGV
jgi:hypothetical protein